MLVKGRLVNNLESLVSNTLVKVVLDEDSLNEVRKEIFKELLEAAIDEVVDCEKLDVLDGIDEWDDWVESIVSHPEEFINDFANDELLSIIETTADEIYEKNKPQYYQVDVTIKTTVGIVVKARNRDDAEDAIENTLSATDIAELVDYYDYEIDDWYIGYEIDEPKYSETVFDAETGEFE